MQVPLYLRVAVTIGLIVAAVLSPGFGADRSLVDPAVPVWSPRSAGASDPLAGMEFGGYVRIGDELQVYLFRPGARDGQWLAVGDAGTVLRVDEFDREREAVRVCAGEHVRWLRLRRPTIVAAPTVRRQDGAMDWDHMNLSNREKEVKAAMQMWELMEIARQVRKGGP